MKLCLESEFLHMSELPSFGAGWRGCFFRRLTISRLLIERSILESNAVRVRQSDEADTPATVVAFTGGLGDGSQDEFGGYHAPVWRIDDGRKCSSSFVSSSQIFLTGAAGQLFTACHGSCARQPGSTR